MERPPPRPPWPRDKTKIPVQSRPARKGISAKQTPKSTQKQNPECQFAYLNFNGVMKKIIDDIQHLLLKI